MTQFVGDGLLEYATRQIWFEVHPDGTSHAPTVSGHAGLCTNLPTLANSMVPLTF